MTRKREVNEYLDEVIEKRGEPEDWEQANRLVMEAMVLLGMDRHRIYGAQNILKFKLPGIVIRMSDKWERLYNIIFNGVSDGGESIEDSLGDIANYGVYGIMCNRSTGDGVPWFSLPLLQDEPE